MAPAAPKVAQVTEAIQCAFALDVHAPCAVSSRVFRESDNSVGASVYESLFVSLAARGPWR